MEVSENNENGEHKASDIHLLDFPFIRLICLWRGDMRLFEQEDYLLDLFLTIRKIVVPSTVNFPSNTCNEFINELEDISLFIDITKYNESSPGKNRIPKKENEYVAIVDLGKSQETVVKAEKTTEEYEEDICTGKSEMCRICLNPFVEKQLFQNVTNIDLKAASISLSCNNICNNCINKLESILLFIILSLSNDMNIVSTLGRNQSLKTENCLEGNAIDITSSKGNDMKFDNILDKKEVKVENYSNESVCSYESKDLHTVVDIKEEILHSPEAPIRWNNQQGLQFCTGNCSNIIPKGLTDSLKVHFQAEHFTCDCCEKSFTCEQCLVTHMLIYPGGKPFKCDSCEWSLSKASSGDAFD